jgi:hypothetical protein
MVSIDKLYLEKLTDEYFQSILDSTKSDFRFIGKGLPYEYISEITLWRNFFINTPLYGHRLAKNKAILSYYPFSEHPDLLFTNDAGITPLSHQPSNFFRDISKAKKQNRKIVGFFGGSTIQGYGSRLPEYSIPAQVQRLLNQDSSNFYCLNLGVAGWTSYESLNYLVHEFWRYLDIAIFYDGWNCSNEFYQLGLTRRTALGKQTELNETFKQVEQQIIFDNQFSLSYLSKRSISLLLSLLINKLPITHSDNYLHSFITKFFSLSSRKSLVDLLNYSVPIKVQNKLLNQARDKYIDIHEKIYLICKAKKIKSIHIYQPLLVNSKKNLSEREKFFMETGLPWGNPEITKKFRIGDKMKLISDFSNIFDNIDAEIFIDSGHLNHYGNYFVASKIKNLIN